MSFSKDFVSINYVKLIDKYILLNSIHNKNGVFYFYIVSHLAGLIVADIKILIFIV